MQTTSGHWYDIPENFCKDQSFRTEEILGKLWRQSETVQENCKETNINTSELLLQTTRYSMSWCNDICVASTKDLNKFVSG